MLQEALKKLRFNQRKIEQEAVREVADEIARLNTEDQLFQKGVDVRGRPLTPPYSPRTKVLKAKKGQPTNRVTLRDTGKMHESTKVDAKEDAIYVEMFREAGGFNVADWLRGHYNQQFEGLTPESIGKLKSIISQAFIKHLRKEFE